MQKFWVLAEILNINTQKTFQKINFIQIKSILSILIFSEFFLVPTCLHVLLKEKKSIQAKYLPHC